MQQKYWFTLLLLLLLPGIMFAQSGKIRGTVVDSKTKEPLIGASIIVEGTSYGSSSDVDGTFIVINMPVGTYHIKASYIGYRSVTMSNVRVNSQITTDVAFELSSEDVQVQAVEIVAERPLIQRNTTNTVRITSSEDIQYLPVRGVQNIISLQAGVVQQAGNLYVRGGRSGEVAYYIDGAPSMNPLFNTDNVTIVQEAVEEIQLQAGGMTAEFGGSNSGVIKTTLRTGGTNYKGSLQFETDDFAKPGGKFLGTTNQGWRNIVASVSGPFPGIDNIRFFALYQNNFQRNRDYMWLTPFSFNLLSDTYDPRGAGQPLPGPFTFQENFVPNNWQDNHTGQGTLVFDLKPVKFNVSATYTHTDQTSANADWPRAIDNYYRSKRVNLISRDNLMVGARATHNLSASTLYEVGVSYNSRASKQYDPDFKDNWRSYTDSAANAAIGYTGFINHWAGPNAYSVIQGFEFLNENSPNNAYNMNNQNSLGGSFDLTSQVSKTWEMKVGARYDYWTMRNFTVNSITGLMSYLYGTYNNAPRDMSVYTPEQYRALIGKAGSINNYGYDVDGNSVDSGPDAPYHPTFASAYFQNKFEYKDIILNFGLRYEYFNSNSKTFRDPLQPLEDFDVNNDVIDPNTLVDAPAYSYVLPRVSFSMPVTVTTVFYAQYGKYVQLPSLNNLYFGQVALSRTVSPSSRGNAYLTPVGYLMTPERTTSYEMGIRQLLSDNFALTLSGFYKDTRDQLEIRNVVDAQGVALYRAYTNNDFGTIKGLELTLELRRTNRFSAKVNYTLSDARGTGSSPNAGSGIVEQGIGRQINFINPLAFNQTHRGSILLDYRWPVSEGGPILSGFGGNILFTFNSGHPYTQIKGLSSIGQASAWDVGVYPTTDPRYSYPIEAINSSTTPFVLNVDLNLSKLVQIGKLNLEVFVNVTNLLNTKQVLNVYPTTGNPGDDGWLTNPLAAGYLAIPQYAEFYKAINLDNRYSWQYLVAGRGQLLGGDVYGIPRQIRIGARIEL